MGQHSQEEFPEERERDLCSQLNAIGWGTEPQESAEISCINIFSRDPNPVGVMKDVADSRTSRLKPKHFAAALEGIDMSGIHIHPRKEMGLQPWLEAFTVKALEAVAYRLGQLQPEPDTGTHHSGAEL